MAHVMMYSKSWCPSCAMAKRLLTEKGQSFTDVDIEAEPARAREMVERSRRTTVPQIWIDEEHVGGFDELAARLGAPVPAPTGEPAPAGPAVASVEPPRAIAFTNTQ